MMVKKVLVAEIEEMYKGNVAKMEDSKFDMEMADYIGDWDWYDALSYAIAKAKNGYVGCYHLY